MLASIFHTVAQAIPVVLSLWLLRHIWRQPPGTPLRLTLFGLNIAVVVWSGCSLLTISLPDSPYLEVFYICKLGAVAFLGPFFATFAKDGVFFVRRPGYNDIWTSATA